MKNQHFYQLFKDSRLAQVAAPMSKVLRGSNAPSPTHQILFAPKGSSSRSEYGIKKPLPKQVGVSHFVMNAMDTSRNIPDVEKFSSPHYNRLKFQESGIVLKKPATKENPLFAWDSSKSLKKSQRDNVVAEFNLGGNASTRDIKHVLKANPTLAKEFKQWLVKRSPESIVFKIPAKMEELLKEFIASSQTVKKHPSSLVDLTRKFGRVSSTAPARSVQGTGGLSYNQKGRLNNTPNGIKTGVIAPGRLVADREAAINGFVASLNERTVALQNNFISNAPGKHPRQFVLPFKISEAELTPTGGIRMYADGVKVGSWIQRTEGGSSYANRSNYVASNPYFGSLSERNSRDATALENLLGLVSKNKS
ncbi:hypothetical protein FT663_00437 [Candidozyma haemuli var. vulneris]|uniref:Uncharacterized protein n=1 Tax=Candidozyma haemuli TaxID=45357 RepID=A0A2V1ASL9_9ASCO|nr:hypothetical protein CXQ85_002298 [[Candida] haemuloni]KAF3993414.1 hypothetical protein FT662_00543 [[Candida] haemuloni var. vulneris]KAF3995384.1 hypothetical protein FT663_00437 [[Candida] haemuloni var. vulneris]PVH20506.1 hypothetical protein CXQ85_002298 [[Candida] haemuloni]